MGQKINLTLRKLSWCWIPKFFVVSCIYKTWSPLKQRISRLLCQESSPICSYKYIDSIDDCLSRLSLPRSVRFCFKTSLCAFLKSCRNMQKPSTRWAPTSYNWGDNPHKWPCKWATGVISPYKRSPYSLLGFGPTLYFHRGFGVLGWSQKNLNCDSHANTRSIEKMRKWRFPWWYLMWKSQRVVSCLLFASHCRKTWQKTMDKKSACKKMQTFTKHLIRNLEIVHVDRKSMDSKMF